MKKNELLIIIPTYNEKGNVENIYKDITTLGIPLDILFIDDNSPDGTGEVLDNLVSSHDNISVIHRKSKLGIGSAHLEGVNYAYRENYQILITMDCDYTHHPLDIPRFLELSKGIDVVVGSRFLQPNSIKGWGFIRIFLTHFGHLLTRHMLNIPFDASGAFRLYNIKNINLDLFNMVESKGYAFFFESLYLFLRRNLIIKEVSITLHKRHYGRSKMKVKDMFSGLLQLLRLYVKSVF